MKISLGCDHGGYALKEHLKGCLTGLGHEVADCGSHSPESCDYPVFAEAAARLVADGSCERGIVICTTGVGVSICANKIKGIRCALCIDAYTAETTRRHNDANMLALGARGLDPLLAERMVELFLSTPFEGGGRHQRRVALMMALEQ